jgi:hypothetical protein
MEYKNSIKINAQNHHMKDKRELKKSQKTPNLQEPHKKEEN